MLFSLLWIVCQLTSPTNVKLPATILQLPNIPRMYNETLRDLLVPDVASPKKLDLQHDSHGGVRVANLSVYDLSSAAHGLSLIEAGCRARSVGIKLEHLAALAPVV
jgi:hypothetical protein